jgi:iron complex outermembrane receptor protein
VLINPMNTCPPPAFGTGFTSTNVAPFMDNVAAVRGATLVRRFVDHQSAYLDIDWQITDSLKLIAEARYVDEDNEVVGPVTAGAQGAGTVTLCGSTGSCNNVAAIPYSIQGAPATFSGGRVLRYDSYQRNDSYVTPKATIQWQPNEQLNIYGSYSLGQKPGGFATLTLGAFGLPARSDIEFFPEKVKVTEIGAKWTSTDRRLLLNGAFFNTDFTDKQVSSQVIIGNTLGNRITNAGGAESQGIELVSQWRATERLTLGLGVTHFFKYDYTDYVTLTSGAAEIARVGNCTPVITLNAAGTAATATCRVSRNGNKMEDVAETSVAVNVGWRQPVGSSGWAFTADLDGRHEGKHFLEDDNTIWLDPYFLANLRLGWENERISVQLFVDNLADDRNVKSAGTGPGTVFANFRTGIITGAPTPPPPVPTSFSARSVFAPAICATSCACRAACAKRTCRGGSPA